MSKGEKKFIPLSTPHIRGNEWEYVKNCLDTEWVSSAGPFVNRFEKEFASYVGSKYAIACSNGTAALHLSLLLAGVKPGDLVLVPTLTFIATINTIRYCGAEPLFFDCDEFYNLSPSQIISFLKEKTERKSEGLKYKATQQKISAALVTHVFGNAANIESILSACQEFHIPLVEDAAESLGTTYNAKAGSFLSQKHTGTLGLMGCFSFNGNKIITTGGGGILVTDNQALAERARYLSTQAKDDEVRFIHGDVGFNYRMPNVLAAIGVAQLEKIQEYKARKQNIYRRYKNELDSVPGLSIANIPSYADNNCWMPALHIDASKYGENRDSLMKRLDKVKIQTRPLWPLNHTQRPYTSFPKLDTPNAEYLYDISLNLPCSIGLSDDDQARVIRELRRES